VQQQQVGTRQRRTGAQRGDSAGDVVEVVRVGRRGALRRERQYPRRGEHAVQPARGGVAEHQLVVLQVNNLLEQLGVDGRGERVEVVDVLPRNPDVAGQLERVAISSHFIRTAPR
jgi:hypothetical protein